MSTGGIQMNRTSVSFQDIRKSKTKFPIINRRLLAKIDMLSPAAACIRTVSDVIRLIS